MFSAMLLGLVALCALGASVGGTQTPVDNDGFEPKFVLVAAPPRMGTTWLFNAARILVRYYDPNVISGFAMSFNEKDLCYWRPRNVSMVVKTHALNLGWMLGANCGRASANGASAPQWTRGFDLALTSFRDPIDAACSLLRKDGNVQKNMCEKVMCEQHAFYHPPSLPGVSSDEAMKVVFELDYRELMAVQGATLHGDAAGENATATSKIFMRSLLRRLASALGLAGQFSAAVLDLVALELSKLRPLGDPRHSLRSAQHPVSLMHANHRAQNTSSTACDSSTNIQYMRQHAACTALAAEHGRQSEALWNSYKWQRNCATLNDIPVPALPAST